MDKDKLIKYALIAVGVYLAYRWLSSSGILGSMMGTTTQPAVGTQTQGQAQTQVGTGTSTSTGASTGTSTSDNTGAGAGGATGTTTGTPSPELMMQAALYKASAGVTGNFVQSPWDWNYWRGQAAQAAGIYVKEQHQPDFSAEEGSAPVTAAQYHAILASRNIDLSGAGWGGSGFSAGNSKPWGVQ